MTVIVSKTTAKKLREQRADLIKKAQEFMVAKEDAESGLLAAEDQQAFDKMLADAAVLEAQSKSREGLEQSVDGLNKPNGSKPPLDPSASLGGDGAQAGRTILVRNGFDASGKPAYQKIAIGARGNEEYAKIFSSYLSGGHSAIGPDQVAALQSDNAEQAGYLVASEQFASEVIKTVDDFCPMRQMAQVYVVREAKSLGLRKRTAKASTFGWSAEVQAPTGDSALKYGKRSLEPHYLSGEITISRDLARTSVVPIDAEVRYELARDGGEVEEQGYMTGNGSQQPLGIFTASTDGISTSRDFASGSATGVTAAGLIACKYSLKEQYRRGGVRQGAQWLFHKDMVSKIAQLSDSAVGFLMRPGRGLQDDDPDTLLGFPVRESEFVPNTYTNGLYCGMLAQFKYYGIAEALDMEILVLVEVAARTNQIVYVARRKVDGQPLLEEAFVRVKCST